MRTQGNKWSSVTEVLDSFNNVSLLPDNDDGDLFTAPPPKHRISSSQLQLLESMGIAVNASPRPTLVSDGSGSNQSNLNSSHFLRERDDALLKDIRATRKSNYSNAAIEDFVNNKCLNKLHQQHNPNTVVENHEKVVSYQQAKSPDQISVKSTLRIDAEDFYPPGMTPDPIKLSQCLERLKGNQESSFNIQSNDSSKTKYVKSTAGPSGLSNHLPDFKTRKIEDDHISFSNTNLDCDWDSDSKDSSENIDNNASTPDSFITYSSSSTPSCQLDNISNFTVNISSDSSQPAVPSELLITNTNIVKNDMDLVPRRQKRSMKNALLSSLQLKQPSHLMTPADFKSGSTSSNQSTDSIPSILSSTSIDINDINETTVPLNTLNPSSSSASKKLLYSKSSSENVGLNFSKPFRTAAKYSLSSWSTSYQYNEQDFPPLS